MEGFETLDRWYRLNQQGVIEPQTDGSYTGSQSLHLKSAEADYVGAYTAFSEPVDLSDHAYSMALKIKSPESLKIRVDLLAPGRENQVRMMRTMPGPTDRWIRVDLGVTREIGTPDLSSVQEIRIVGQKHDPSDPPVDILVDDFRLLDPPKQGQVMLMFDGTWKSHYETALPMLDEFGFKGIEGVIADLVYGTNNLDVGMMREMQEAGWDMASLPASKEYLTDLSTSKQRQLITENKEFLVRKGFEKGAKHFITPSRRRGPETMDIVRNQHETMFTFGGMPNALPSTTQYNYSRINAGPSSAVKELIDLSAKYNQLLVCRSRDIGSGRPDAMNKADYREFLTHVDNADVKVITATDLLELQA